MSRYKKAANRLLAIPKDYFYIELKSFLKMIGYYEYHNGKTSGSRVTFINSDNHIIKLHKPHGKGVLKEYQIKLVIKCLRKTGVLK